MKTLISLILLLGCILRTSGQAPPKPLVACDPAPSGMVAWWNAEGNALDCVGGNNGTLVGGLGFAPGAVGQAFNFEDTNGFVLVPASPQLNVGMAGGFTIEEWISPSNAVAPMPLFGWGTNAAGPANTNILAGPILNTNNGHYFYLLQSNTWTASEAVAEQLGGHLATIRSTDDNLWVSNTFASYGGQPRNLWIGFYNPTHDSSGGNHPDNFVWADGEPVSFTDWMSGEPNDCDSQEYWTVVLAPYPTYPTGQAGLWNDTTNSGGNCGSSGGIVIYGVVEATNLMTGVPYLWTSVGTAGCLYANLVDSANGSHMLASAGSLIQSNVYQHVAWTYDTNSGLATLYLNGAVVASANLGSFVPNTAGDVYLGKRNDGVLTNIYSGGMDEVSVYSRALSAAEIAAIYQAGSAGKCYTPTAPAIWSQPVGQTNLFGTNAIFTVRASGGLPLSYQWRFDGTNLPAATNSILGLTNLSLSEGGIYDVVITNYQGSVTSSPAILDVFFIMVEVNGQLDTGTATSPSPAPVTLLGGYPGGYLFYTLDGSAPSTSSTLYTKPFNLTNSAIVRVLSLSSDFSQTQEGIPVTVQVVPTYVLQTSIVGNGTVSTNPPGGVYVSNSVVQLTATAALHWAFDHWAGDATGSQTQLNLTMSGPRNVQAVFVQNAYPLTLSTPGGGNVSANGQIIAAGTYYTAGSLVTNRATPNSGWSFLRWQGSVSSTNNPLILTINQTNNLQAIFGTVVATSAAGGQIVLSQPNPVPYGTTLALSAVPDPGNYFLNWTGSSSGSANPISATVISSTLSYNALFTPLPPGKLSLSVLISGSGSINIFPQRTYYSQGDTVQLIESAGSGNYFFGWTLGAAGTANPLAFVMTTNKVVQANFGVGSTVTIAPLNQTVLAGSNAVLTASAMGLSPLAYQWQNGQGAIAGATNSVYTISNTQPANAGNYWVVVSNSIGSVTSVVATVTVIGAPIITNQPAAATVTIGHAASLDVGACGWPAMAYQWRLNGANLSGATGATLALQNAFPADGGFYTVAITNVYGSVTSNPALLTVLPLAITTPGGPVNGQFQFSFDTAVGINYEVDYSTNLLDWHPWLDVGGNGQPFRLSDPNLANGRQRFYRIVLSPQ